MNLGDRPRAAKIRHAYFKACWFRETDSDRIEVRQGGPGRFIEIDADQESLRMKAEIDFLHHAAGCHCHGTALVLAGIAAGAEPFEKRSPAVDFHVQERARQGMHGALTAAADGPCQIGGRRIAQQNINVLQMFAK